MKRAGLILAAVAILIVGALGGMLYWAFQQMEQSKNKDKTEAARAARWQNKDAPGKAPETETEPETAQTTNA